ncbi:MAG: fatty-acyl-CoA synthase [Actinomycetota bacterium]|nr:fatty-acyl-CoA synthase [Actinomycetota bacterium]
MPSVVSRLETAADGGAAVTFVGTAAGVRGAVDRVEWSRLHDDARGIAAALQARGVGPGIHVGILGPTTRALVTAIQATFLAGGTVVALPLPMRLGSIEEFVEQTRRRIANADAGLVIVDPDLAPFLDPPGAATLQAPIVPLDALAAEGARLGADAVVRPPDDADRLAILQFTSGSTSAPKGVMLPDRCVGANIDAIVAAAGINHDDRAVSWLPLYHDMGLIGLLMTPMLNGFELVLGAPQDFLAAPSRWLEWISEYRGTITAGPNFSYALAARALRRAGALDLSSWRLALNGAETVDPSAVEAFCAAAAPFGFDSRAAYPVFGMAEATLGVTFPKAGAGMTVDAVDRHALEHERRAIPAPIVEHAADVGAVRRLAVLGRPLPGFELRIVDPGTGATRADREVGELELRSPSVTPGYYRNPEATAATFDDGWLRTGDLAYLVDGQLVVCGRLKDMIIVGGRNVFPEDVERAAGSVVGVRTGNVIAFGSDRKRGRESIVVVAETKGEDLTEVHESVVNHVCDAFGVPPVEVVLVRPGTLPKTSSGKLQRSLCRDRYHDDQLEPV